MKQQLRHTLLTVGVTAAATAAATAFVRNFISGERKIRHRIAQNYGISDPQFERSMSQLLGPPILDGNLVQPLRNGVEIFPAMLAAIERAERSVTFETFVYWSGRIAQRFADVLSARARAGVKVHVLVDGVGCNCVNGPALRQMIDAGVQVEVYHISNLTRANHRTHRKLLVIDGRIGFTGGVGIADQWDGNAASPNEWRDSHYRVEGPVVAQMQAAFLDNWMKTRAIVLHGKTMIIDGLWTSVGSANFDNRSFRLNDEANLNIIDREIAAGEAQAFNRDLACSRRFTYQDWQRRPFLRKVRDSASALLRSQL